jgi:hypothetical protein
MNCITEARQLIDNVDALVNADNPKHSSAPNPLSNKSQGLQSLRRRMAADKVSV